MCIMFTERMNHNGVDHMHQCNVLNTPNTRVMHGGQFMVTYLLFAQRANGSLAHICQEHLTSVSSEYIVCSKPDIYRFCPVGVYWICNTIQSPSIIVGYQGRVLEFFCRGSGHHG